MCEVIYTGQEIFKSSTDWPWSNEINMNMAEPSVWSAKCSERCVDMLVHLWILTGYTGTCPGRDMLHIHPKESSRNQLHCGHDSRCARLCRVSKIAWRVFGSRGRGESFEVLQIICMSKVGTGRFVNLPVAYLGDDRSNIPDVAGLSPLIEGWYSKVMKENWLESETRHQRYVGYHW